MRRTILFTLAIFAVGWMLVSAVVIVPKASQTIPPVPFSVDRIAFDYFDIAEQFYTRSSWVADHIFPYDQAQEYPQIGLLYISLPRLVSSSVDSYLLWYLALAVVTFAVFLYVVNRLLKELHLEQWRLWFLVLPSFVFFAISRFDLFAALLVLVSVLFLFKKKYTLSFVVLVLAGLTKWYAFLLVPFFLAFIPAEEKKTRHALWWGGGTFVVVMAATFFMSGEKALFPYVFHLTRGNEGGSLLSLVLPFVLTAAPAWYATVSQIVMWIFFAIQVSPAVYGLAFFRRVKAFVAGKVQLLQTSTFVTLAFVLFGKFYSPQWEIWWLSLMLFVAKGRKEIALVIAADLLNYVQFPIVFRFAGKETLAYGLVVFVRSIIMLWLLWRLGKRILHTTHIVTPHNP